MFCLPVLICLTGILVIVLFSNIENENYGSVVPTLSGTIQPSCDCCHFNLRDDSWLYQ